MNEGRIIGTASNMGGKVQEGLGRVASTLRPVTVWVCIKLNTRNRRSSPEPNPPGERFHSDRLCWQNSGHDKEFSDE
jgi:hypothetical protein